jgi:hypothetical protein
VSEPDGQPEAAEGDADEQVQDVRHVVAIADMRRGTLAGRAVCLPVLDCHCEAPGGEPEASLRWAALVSWTEEARRSIAKPGHE